MEFVELPIDAPINSPQFRDIASGALGVQPENVELREIRAEGYALGKIERQIVAESDNEQVRLVFVEGRWRVI